MKLNKHKTEIIVALITLIGSITVPIIISNNQALEKQPTIENKVSVEVPVNINPRVTSAKKKILPQQDFAAIRRTRLSDLIKQGENLCKDYPNSKESLIKWINKSLGFLKETRQDIDDNYRIIKENHLTNDYHSQAKDILEMLYQEAK